MSDKLPFMNSTGLVTTILDKIIEAQTPPRYSHDFQAAKLGYGSGSAKPFVPLLKNLGFITADGTPTDLYKQFRNQSLRGRSMAEAIKKGYAPLYAISEYAHELDPKKLKDAVIQATGHSKDSSSVTAIVGTFNALKAYADFDHMNDLEKNDNEEENLSAPVNPQTSNQHVSMPTPLVENRGMNIAYTINLNLPETKDPEVFDAIFSSLKEKLLN